MLLQVAKKNILHFTSLNLTELAIIKSPRYNPTSLCCINWLSDSQARSALPSPQSDPLAAWGDSQVYEEIPH